MKIAITLASGRLAKAIIKRLLDEVDANQLIGIARGHDKLTHLGVETRKGDYDIPADFEESLQGVDVLLLVSGVAAPGQRREQHKNVINAAVANGVRKVVYTSIIGDEDKTSFKAIVESNRQTERDLIESGMEYVIGRNALYIEPDLEYIDNYEETGGIINSANDGKCGYTTRTELAEAYTKLLLGDSKNGGIYNLIGETITQTELANHINTVYGTSLHYKSISVESYLQERKAELGDFIGTVISGIYENIRNGAFNVPSHFEEIVGRSHKSTLKIIEEFKKNNK